MWSRDAGAFRRVFERYCDYVYSQGFPFDYCDVLADFTRRVVHEIDNSAMLRSAVQALAGLGSGHKRWHVRDVLVTLLQSVRDNEAAVAAVEGLRAAGPGATQWSVQDFSLRSLHPTLRGAIAQFLEEDADEDS